MAKKQAAQRPEPVGNKGKQFTHADLPRTTQQRIERQQVSEEELKRLDAWLAAQTERNRIVAYDGETPLIAEELQERAMRHHAGLNYGQDIDPAVLRVLRDLMTLDEDQRYQVLQAFEPDTPNLCMPFERA